MKLSENPIESSPKMTTGPAAQEEPTIYIGVASSQGMRPHMEDSFTMVKNFKVSKNIGVLENPAVFLALYDGHASHRGSDLASRRLHQILSEQLQIHNTASSHSMIDNRVIEFALKSAFEKTDIEMIDLAASQGSHFGSTAVTALFLGNTVHVAHVGDSRAVLYRRKDRVIRLTKDHKPASHPQERARIERIGGKILYDDDRVLSNPEPEGKQSKLNMSRALGDAPYKFPHRLVVSEPNVVHMYLTPDCTFCVLGSDGLFELLNCDQVCVIADTALQHATESGCFKGDALAGDVARVLVREALQRGSSDNVTAAVALFFWNKYET